RIAGFREQASVHCEAWALQRKHEMFRHFRGPLAERRRGLGAIEGAVDFDRRQVRSGVSELARVWQPLGVKYPAPRLISPPSNTRVNIALLHCHALVMSGV